ncbi:EVE domain-containing protein [Ammoniphilus sp. 3BR4]|uniref:EVE domain-containing protein n=1 Tax=Ammoniphilus sp. 3BR4 TaxID=3158265 RepID=UPI003467626F
MNTWIFQGNPRVFNIDSYVSQNNKIWWSLRQHHFEDQIQIDDEVFLWRSDGSKKGSGGILAKARVIGLPQERTDEDAREYWYTQDWNNPALGVKLEIEEVRLEGGFLKRTELMKNPILEDMLIFRLRQQTNYLLEESHADELRRLWNSQGNNRSFSWLRLFQDVAVKELDKSAFLHNGTGVPVDMRDFF